MRLRHSRVQFDRHLQISDGTIVFAAGQIDAPAHKSRHSVFRLKPRRRLRNLQRFIKDSGDVLGLEVYRRDHHRVGQPRVGKTEIRIQLNRPAEMPLRLQIGLGVELILDRQPAMITIPRAHFLESGLARAASRKPFQFGLDRRGYCVGQIVLKAEKIIEFAVITRNPDITR